ncbi:hypothetical protein ABZ816_15975 [Actinosynnema sp. NPDC047251]|uniref:hypothetical protein n=1 Tax=Saccharothrix espanaensis TaxID=103731 RepID=UPI00059C63B6|nr:hypothetical protein [Saccharothrix espanaensis]
MEVVFGITYIIGMITTAGIARSRAGLGQGGRLSFLTILGSSRWFLTQMVSMFTWPLFLCVWLVRGRPKSPWKVTTTSAGTMLIRHRPGN